MDIFLAIAGVIIGAVITWAVAKRYYMKASKDLKKEAEDLRKLNILMIRAMEEAGLAKFNRDSNGNLIGLIFDASLSLSTSSATSVSAELSGGKQKDNKA